MKKFFYKSLMFVLIFIITTLFFEFLSRKMYRAKTDLAFQFESLDKFVDDIEVLFFGNSHTAKSVNPQWFDFKCFNLAFGSQDFYYDHALFFHYYPQMPQLKAIILTFDYFSLGYDESNFSRHLIKEYYDEKHIKPRYGLTLKFYMNYLLLFLHKDSFIGDILQGKQRLKNNSIVDSWEVSKEIIESSRNNLLFASGYRFARGSLTKKQFKYNSRERVMFHYKECQSAEALKQNLILIKSIIETAQNEKIKVIILIPPYTEYYINQFPDEFLKKLYDDIHLLLSNYPKVNFIDFSNSGLFSDKMFLNSDHLNYTGSVKFSRILSDSLSRIFYLNN